MEGAKTPLSTKTRSSIFNKKFCEIRGPYTEGSLGGLILTVYCFITGKLECSICFRVMEFMIVCHRTGSFFVTI